MEKKAVLGLFTSRLFAERTYAQQTVFPLSSHFSLELAKFIVPVFPLNSIIFNRRALARQYLNCKRTCCGECAKQRHRLRQRQIDRERHALGMR